MRCHARVRTSSGWERCHDDSGHGGAHHITDRTWLPLRFTPPCGCGAATDLIVYFGGVPMTAPGVKASAWPTRWQGGPVY